VTFIRQKTRRKNISPKHAYYERLRVFREQWEAAGGSRGSLRRARKSHGALFPPLPEGYIIPLDKS